MRKGWRRAIVGVAIFLAPGFDGAARAESQRTEIEELKKAVESLQNTVDRQNDRIRELEEGRAQPAAPPAVQAPAAVAEMTGPASPVTERGAFNDQQQAAPRPDDLTLDPKFRGFLRIPNTQVLIQFNAKPRVDMTYDSQNAGDDNRFVTAKIPVDGDPSKGASPYSTSTRRARS